MARLTVVVVFTASLGACAPSIPDLHPNLLDNAIGAAIGDPATCLLLADGSSGRVVYRYGADFNCARSLPACDRPGLLSAESALRFAVQSGGRVASCSSVADGSRSVGWCEGRVPNAARVLTFSAVMEGPDALPGSWMRSRLLVAFRQSGL